MLIFLKKTTSVSNIFSLHQFTKYVIPIMPNSEAIKNVQNNVPKLQELTVFERREKIALMLYFKTEFCSKTFFKSEWEWSWVIAQMILFRIFRL